MNGGYPWIRTKGPAGEESTVEGPGQPGPACFWTVVRGVVFRVGPALLSYTAAMGFKPWSRAVRVGGLGAGLGLLLGGCSAYEAPNLKVVDARVSERSTEGVVLMFTIDAENPNEEGLPLRSVDYRVSLDGREVFTGTRSAEATLRRYGTQQIRLPAVVALTEPGAGETAANYRIEGTLRYITPGEIAEILFDAGVRQPSVSFSGEGRADLTAAAPAPPAPEGRPEPKKEAPKPEPAEKKEESKQ